MSWWASPSIRARLAGWYMAALFLMMVVYATATFLAVRHEFREQMDDELHEDFETIESELAPAPGGRIVWTGDPRGMAEADTDRLVDVWSIGGRAIYRSDESSVLPPLIQPAGNPTYESLQAAGHRWRTLTAPASVGSQAILLRVSRSEDRLRGQLWEIFTVLVFGLPLVVALAGGGGYLLARRALAPIDQLASEARRITADRLHERLSVPNPNDEIGRLAGVINDTFARLEASFDQLRQFTADASHELRTPLAVIRGIGEVGLGRTRNPAEYQEAIGSMLEEVDRLTTLVDTLLRLSRADAGTVRLRRESADLGWLSREVATALALLAEERGQRLVVDAADSVTVSIDRLVLREAIANVIDNAIKYSPPASTIRVRVRREQDRAVLEVEDQGPGVSREHRERIFDRFVRVDEGRSRDRGGSGLGLAIAKWAVDVNDGRISVGGGAGGGALFRIELPIEVKTHGSAGEGQR